MQRRFFLQGISAGGVLLGSGLNPLVHAQTDDPIPTLINSGVFPPNDKRILLNIALDGGPDFRHLLPPAFVNNEDDYSYQYWEKRATAHSIAANPDAYAARWEGDFLQPTQQAAGFGILNNSQWLFDMWEAGNVAIVNNALGSNTRDHAQALLVLEHGDRSSREHDVAKPGWGGRLAAALQAQAQESDPSARVKIVSLTHEIRRFCYGPHPSDPRRHVNTQVLAVRNSRNMGLFTPDTGIDADNPRWVMHRALKSYYAAKRQEMDSLSPYYKFIQHEADQRDFGEAIREKLIGEDEENPNVPIPDEIRALYDVDFAEANGLFSLNQGSFGRQIRNLYDCLVCNDIINFQIASMAYRGFDTHKNQKRYLEQRFEDLFHEKGGLATLYKHLPSDITDNLVIVLAGEFGRQLKANGDRGTDHGRGNAILVIGNGIQGGVYGDMFPADELNNLAKRSPDIVGKTGIEHIFANVCEYMSAGTGAEVFPTLADAPLEEGVNEQLFLG